MKNAIGYIRISTQDQSQYSLTYQERAVREYCKTNNLNLLELFQDNGESSYTFDRPDWRELEQFIRKNKSVDYLIIFDHDRFSRNLAEALLKIKELQTKFGINVLATTDRIDTDHADPSTYIMRAFKYMMAESELMRIRERTKAGLIQAAMSGYFANKAPYGYKNSRTEDKKPLLVIDKAKAEIVKKIYKLKLQGLAPEQIRAAVKPLGFHHKNKSAIQDILANPVYAGLVKVPEYKNRPSYLTKGVHKAIISENDYYAVQGSGRTFNIQKKDEVPLRGVLKCWCGKPVTAGNSKSSTGRYYWYYLCNEHKQNLSAVKLHKQFDQILEHLQFTNEDVEYFRDRLGYKIAVMMQTRAEELGATEKDLKDINCKISDSEEKYLSNSDINPETFKRVITDLKYKKSILEKKLNELKVNNQHYMEQLEVLLPKLKNLKEAYEAMSLESKQRFVNVVFAESLSYSEKIYRTNFLHPFFEHNALVLNEKGLLKIQRPVVKMSQNSTCIQSQTPIELLEQLLKVFTA